MLGIEDTDQERFQEGALDIIYRTLEHTGRFRTEVTEGRRDCGPYVQSERNARGYHIGNMQNSWIDQGTDRYRFCNKERPESLRTCVADKDIVVYDKHCLHLTPEEVQEKPDKGLPYVIRINMPEGRDHNVP